MHLAFEQSYHACLINCACVFGFFQLFFFKFAFQLIIESYFKRIKLVSQRIKLYFAESKLGNYVNEPHRRRYIKRAKIIPKW